MPNCGVVIGRTSAPVVTHFSLLLVNLSSDRLLPAYSQFNLFGCQICSTLACVCDSLMKNV